MATQSELLILRGLNLLIRASFSPNEPAKQAKHFLGLQNDIGPWLTDYAAELEKEYDHENTLHRRQDRDPGL